MVNIIWVAMFIIGIIYAAFNGTMEEVSEALFQSAEDAIGLTLSLMSVLVFWLGMMNIAKHANILDFLAKLFRPMVVKLFPEIPPNHRAFGYILANMIANIFGLGSAATPMGLKAMQEMKTLQKGNTASRSMITFLALNTSSLTLIPTKVIAIRMKYGSVSPTEIVLTTIIATLVSTCSAIILDRFFHFYDTRKKG